jgi:hypothetical protein
MVMLSEVAGLPSLQLAVEVISTLITSLLAREVEV